MPAAPPLPESPAAGAPARTPRVIWKPGMELSAGTDTEDLVPTDDVELARKQVSAYPDNPEASFILAVALTRTSRVEEALQEVRRARKLAEAKGGPAYFDKMIESYEDMLKHHPRENRVRYGLAWAYYMKAYMLAKYSRRAAKAAADPAAQSAPPKKTNVWELAAAAANGKIPANAPHIQGALEKADPSAAPHIRKYYELALGKLDELLKQKPDDIWARVYRAFLKAEYSGNLEEAMTEWRKCQAQAPNNPAPYFFLGEAYLKQGNLKECINNISKAIALRAIGN
ncbi:MAG TPA: tetratricopeptide repeat protein [Candidatus Obscuribacterales bacterium]